MELPYYSTIALLGIYLKEAGNEFEMSIAFPYVHCSTIAIAKIWRQPQCPSVDESLTYLFFPQADFKIFLFTTSFQQLIMMCFHIVSLYFLYWGSLRFLDL